MSPLTYGSLFSGVDGLGSGVRSVLGGRLAWYADCCKFEKDGTAGHYTPHRSPCSIMAHHHPGVPNLGDVTKVDWHNVPRVDVMDGGSPCQDLSNAGKRLGMKAGTRSGLWASMCDAIEIIRPSLVVWENVRGALSAEATSGVEPCPLCMGDDPGVTLRALGRVLGDLSELGYDARWYGLRAADVGAAHSRFRIFLFATPRDSEGVGMERLWPQGLEIPPSSPFTRLPGRPGHTDDGGVTLLPTPAVNDMGDGKSLDWWDEWAPRQKSAKGAPAVHGKSLAIEAQRLLPTPEATLGSAGPDYARAGRDGAGGDDLTTTVAKMLPTPRATDGTKGGPNQHGSSGDAMLPSAVQKLLPTPVVTDAASSARHTTTTGVAHPGTSLTDATRLLPTPSAAEALGGHHSRSGDRKDEPLLGGIAKLLPTPNASDTAKHAGQPAHKRDGHQERLTDAVEYPRDWGEYAAAIRQWEEVIGRPAPAPTEKGKKGQPVLSPRFVEWMMGLPDGHVTAVPGVGRNDQLKALGNGVVPQQAAAATQAFLFDTYCE